ncbi:MAG TPA: hypothetical protein VD794_00320 [Flavisolibacter sp.]|nr:hypothetical protein [Flavisolibacter sp.]
MRRIISILFLSLMLLQAIPVLHFFSSQKEVFYVYIDEEKLEEKKDSKVSKELFTLIVCSPAEQLIKTYFSPGTDTYYSSPLLEFLTPPPDHC